MKIQCPHCGVKGSADDSYHGQKVKCPRCQGVFHALQAIAEPPPPGERAAPAPLDETPVESDTPVSETLPGDVQAVSEEPLALEKETLVADPGMPVEDFEDIGAADDVSTAEDAAVEENGKPADEAEDLLAWADIASEIDKEIVEESKRGEEEEGEPAILHSLFEDAAPTVDDLIAPAGKIPQESFEVSPPVAEIVPPAMESPAVSAPLIPGLPQEPEPVEEKNDLTGVESQPYGIDKEQCWQCGKKDSVGVPFIAKDGRLYCPDCLLAEEPVRHAGVIPPGPTKEGTDDADSSPSESRYSFTIGGLLKEAWAKTKGTKATVWAASAVMYVAVLLLVAGGAFILPYPNNYGGAGTIGVLGNILFQLISNVVSVVFSAGLIFIGIRRVAGEAITWKMVFEGFSVTGKLIVATILQTVLIIIGFLLLILPGIYLAIGYAMTVPLIVDRKMSPWQAMETSRKAIHSEWWKMFGLFIIMSLVCMVSAIPLGIGLIWTWPMFVVLGGVVYRSLFGIEKRVG